ncbi:DUF6117 family protein [Novosphingobium meiothermophilum]|uniref:DUF6117 family protein n=1 Tax=Novosphingobium meiothermophilum TaxID=2202251 RepID=UPI000D6E0BB7|nr:DUF6117 family protein [Novosphingobium meiothermophilum]
MTIKPAPPIPEHHRQWFKTLIDAAKSDDLALMSCLDAETGEPRSVICAVGRRDGEFVFTPFGNLATADNPYDAYIPPEI